MPKEISEMQGKLLSIIGLLENVQTSPADIENAMRCAQELSEQANRLDGYATEEARREVAAMKQLNHTLADSLDQLQGDMAKLYRLTIGDRKEWFERLSAAEQKAQEPTTYVCKMNYEYASTARDLVADLNALLLDVSGDMEFVMQDHPADAAAARSSADAFEGEGLSITPTVANDPPAPTVSP